MRLGRWLGLSLLSLAAASSIGLLTASAQQEPPRAGGQYWFGRYGCTACHGGDGKGTLIGVPIVARPDSPLTADFILHQLRQPREFMPDFPAEVLSDDKARAIIDWVGTLERNAAASGAPKPSPSLQTKPGGQLGGAD
jgi:mono/diheme cytochrome c family protein